MYNTTINKLPGSKIEILASLPPADFLAYTKDALEEIAKNTELDGFRKGTAPKELVRQRVGQAKILEEAAKLAIEKIYPQIIAENKIEPLGYPEINITKLAPDNPFEFKAILFVLPEVKLPDYKQIAMQFQLPKVEVTEEEIKQLKMEKERRERERLKEDLINRISAAAEFDVPDVLVESETNRMLENMKKRTLETLHMNFEEYLKAIKKTEKELHDEMFSQNQQKIKNYLVLQEIAKLENIEATAEEIEKAVSQAAAENQKGDLDLEQIKEYYKDIIKTEKVFERLESLFGTDKAPNS